MRRLAFIVDLVNVFSLLRSENDRSAVALDNRDCKKMYQLCVSVFTNCDSYIQRIANKTKYRDSWPKTGTF